MEDSQAAIMVQARTGSTRLPGKITRPFHGGHTLLDVMLQRLKANAAGLPVVLATSTNPNDAALGQVAEAHGVQFFQGHEDDVLQRFADAADHFGYRTLVRICSDNPFLDSHHLNHLVEQIAQHPQADYLSYRVGDGTPVIKTHLGLFGEVVTAAALKKVKTLTTEAFQFEHVTLYVYQHPGQFNVHWLDAPAPVLNRPDLRMTVDTEADFTRMQQVYGHMMEEGGHWPLETLVAHLDAQPQLLEGMRQTIAEQQK